MKKVNSIVKSLTKITNQLNQVIDVQNVKIALEEDVQAASRLRALEAEDEIGAANKWLKVLPSVK